MKKLTKKRVVLIASVFLFVGLCYGSVATPDNIAFGLYDLEGENAEITD